MVGAGHILQASSTKTALIGRGGRGVDSGCFFRFLLRLLRKGLLDLQTKWAFKPIKDGTKLTKKMILTSSLCFVASRTSRRVAGWQNSLIVTLGSCRALFTKSTTASVELPLRAEMAVIGEFKLLLRRPRIDETKKIWPLNLTCITKASINERGEMGGIQFLKVLHRFLECCWTEWTLETAREVSEWQGTGFLKMRSW